MKTDERTGLPVNRSGRVTVYHGTTKAAAELIRATGRIVSAGEPRVYFSNRASGTGYGDGTVLAFEVNPDVLELDDEFPDGRQDFSVPVGKKGLSLRPL